MGYDVSEKLSTQGIGMGTQNIKDRIKVSVFRLDLSVGALEPVSNPSLSISQVSCMTGIYILKCMCIHFIYALAGQCFYGINFGKKNKESKENILGFLMLIM